MPLSGRPLSRGYLIFLQTIFALDTRQYIEPGTQCWNSGATTSPTETSNAPGGASRGAGSPRACGHKSRRGASDRRACRSVRSPCDPFERMPGAGGNRRRCRLGRAIPAAPGLSRRVRVDAVRPPPVPPRRSRFARATALGSACTRSATAAGRSAVGQLGDDRATPDGAGRSRVEPGYSVERRGAAT